MLRVDGCGKEKRIRREGIGEVNWKGRVSLRISVGFGEGQGSGLGDGENGRYSAREK